MIQRPAFVTDAQIVAKLEQNYGLRATNLCFLPVGEASWCYRAESAWRNWFIKLAKRKLCPASILIPGMLRASFVNPAIPNMQGCFWDTLAGHPFVVYPYVEGRTLLDGGLAAERWQEVGRMLASLHATRLEELLLHELRRECFVSPWTEGARRVITHADNRGLTGTSAELACFIRERASEMCAIVSHAELLGRLLQARQLELVLCHGDPNKVNILLTRDDRLLLIDWDGITLAPAERDLMFFTGAERDLFMQGYTARRKFFPDATALAYYKYEWVVQEFCDYGTRLFFAPDLDEAEQQHALQAFYQLFTSEGVVEQAYAADPLNA